MMVSAVFLVQHGWLGLFLFYFWFMRCDVACACLLATGLFAVFGFDLPCSVLRILSDHE